MKNIGIFFLTFVSLLILSFIGIQIDLSINGVWLKPASDQFGFWNIVTSGHGITVLYLRGWLWIVPIIFFSLLGGAAQWLKSR